MVRVFVHPDLDKVHVYFKIGNMLHTFIDFVRQAWLLINPLEHIHIHQYPKDLDPLDSSSIPCHPNGSVFGGFWLVLVQNRNLAIFG